MISHTIWHKSLDSNSKYPERCNNINWIWLIRCCAVSKSADRVHHKHFIFVSIILWLRIRRNNLIAYCESSLRLPKRTLFVLWYRRNLFISCHLKFKIQNKKIKFVHRLYFERANVRFSTVCTRSFFISTIFFYKEWLTDTVTAKIIKENNYLW